jgi:hypothetical protein
MAANPIAPLMTVDEFLRIHGDDDDRYELIEVRGQEQPERVVRPGRGCWLRIPMLDRSKLSINEFQRGGARRGNHSNGTP